MIARFRVNWEEQYDAARLRIVRAEQTPGDYREAGERCLENAYRRLYPFDDETLGLEREIQFPLDPEGQYAFRGVIDRLVRARDGALEIHDYKTGRRVPSQAELDRDRQLALYEIGAARPVAEGLRAPRLALPGPQRGAHSQRTPSSSRRCARRPEG